VNKKLKNIEYKNPNYPGVMMFSLGMGKYEVEFGFESTADRNLGYVVSLMTGVFLTILVFRFRRNEIR
jgi:hypothetical protein